MNRPDYLSISALAEPAYERRDEWRRNIVDQGISVQQECNTMSAIEYLKAHDIDASVIERVLLDPQRRRANLVH